MFTVKKPILFTLALFLSTTPKLMASAGSIQQSILTVDRAPTLENPTKKMLSAPRTAAEAAARLKELIKNPAYKAAYEKMLKHPNLTFTSKSVFTPAAIPMRFGGIGFSAGIINRYPTATKNSWPAATSIALPFGDSDRLIGGAVSVNSANLSNNIYPNSSYGNNTGTVSLILSRWLARNTIVSAGVINLIPWGQMKQAPYSYNAVLTQMFGLPIAGNYHPMSASVGFGSGTFVPLGQAGASHDSTIYPFANAAFNFTPNLAIAGDYYADTFAVGLSYNTATKAKKRLPLNWMLYAGNLKHSKIAPSTVFGLRVSTGLVFPSFKRA